MSAKLTDEVVMRGNDLGCYGICVMVEERINEESYDIQNQIDPMHGKPHKISMTKGGQDAILSTQF